MTNNVSRYYDLNTSRFIRFGHGGSSAAIHRAVWAEGAGSRAEAVDYVNNLISRYSSESGALKILDIGCGIGGSMAFLAGKTGADVTGVTISQVQASAGQDYLEKRGFSDKCRIIEGDFIDRQVLKKITDHTKEFDMLYAVESFLHMEDYDRFFFNSSKLLRSSGELVICDDFLSSDNKAENPQMKKTEKLIEQFKNGWQVNTLLSSSRIITAAEKHGFTCISRLDLTAYLELNRPRDILIRALVPVVRFAGLSSPFWSNLTGGDALQQLLSGRHLNYLVFRFKKRDYDAV